MPRPTSENTFQVSFTIPPAIVEAADREAERLRRASPGTTTTRTEVLRAALIRGMNLAQGRAAEGRGQ